MTIDEKPRTVQRPARDGSLGRHTCALRWGMALLAALASLCIVPGGRLHASPPSAFQVETAMIYNMTRYVDWPEESFPAANAPFTICVLGKGELAAAVAALQGKTIKGRPVVVRQIVQVGEKEACQIAVIDKSERRRLRSLLKQLSRNGVLTVSDAPRFAAAGGAVGFVELDGRVTFEINPEAGRQSRVRISSQLLKLAHIVREGE
ncbi:MAG TPA: YfiR family protein [Geobacteraceae bacterium]